ncbi:MAG TPA: dioxygenase [Jatrophihabitans sp.]|uniref:dioxygenase family protein n=1 Tax=Jatrophihabitans sp. TaxID=1932789 RepID=UPI002DF744CB|nr:dioxygenase [Jatrophihabitans sp.]
MTPNPDTDEARTSPEQRLLDTVLASFDRTPDERLRTVLTTLVRHLHAVVRETRLTEAEWQHAIAFLTRTGQASDDRRQEFILLSDVLGVSMQTVVVNDDATGGATEATVLGPFFVADAPAVQLGGDIAAGAPGEPCWVEGRITGTDGRPLAGARVEVWEADDDGFYDVQYADGRTAARARLETDTDGHYRFWALTPTPYPIPADGPVGDLLAATGRTPMRAPHLHFRVGHPEARTLTTHAFVAGDGLAVDSVFGLRDSLVVDFARAPRDAPTPDGRIVDSPTWTRARFDIVLTSNVT